MNGKNILAVFSAVIAYCLVSHASAQEDCVSPSGLSSITSNTGVRFVVFGEVHGTVEVPAFFAESVCAAVASGKKVLVGLEFPESSAGAFQQFLQSAGNAEDEKKLLLDSTWGLQAASFPDGRTSGGMFDLVRRLRALHASGYELSIAPFVRALRARGESQTPYEKGLASSLMDAYSSGTYDLVMVLVGNVHAFNATIRADVPFEPMAMHLPRNETITLNMVSDGGTAWNCNPECGPHPLRVSNKTNAVGIVTEKGIAPGYDGIFSIGTASASPPVTEVP